jgi:hypothetical protein
MERCICGWFGWLGSHWTVYGHQRACSLECAKRLAEQDQGRRERAAAAAFWSGK